MKKLALRKKIKPPLESKNKDSYTRVIILDGESASLSELEQIKKEIISETQEHKDWSSKYDNKFTKHTKLADYYNKIIDLVLQRINSSTFSSSSASIREIISKEVRAALRDQSSSNISNKLNREFRRIIVSRLISLIVNLEPLFEIFSNKEIVRVVISNKLYPRIFNRLEVMTSPKWFVSVEESTLLLKVLQSIINEENMNYPIISREGYDDSLLLKKINENEISIVRAAQKGSVMLDLIRSKFLSPQVSRSITKFLSVKGSGILVTGGPNYGKTQVLSAVISSLPLNISPLIIGKGDTLKKSHPHALFIDSSTIRNKESNYFITPRLVEDFIINSGVGIIIVDEIDSEVLFLLHQVKLKYKLPILASVRGVDISATLYSLYSDNSKILEDFSNIFHFVIELNKGISGNYVKTIYETIPGKNEIKTLAVLKAVNVDTNIEWESSGLGSDKGVF